MTWLAVLVGIIFVFALEVLWASAVVMFDESDAKGVEPWER